MLELKGLRVSVDGNEILKGIDLNVNCNSLLFLNVIIPLAEKKLFKSKSLLAKFLLPVKQCIRIFGWYFV